MGRLLAVLSVFGEYERELIVERATPRQASPREAEWHTLRPAGVRPGRDKLGLAGDARAKGPTAEDGHLLG